jgi:hypothetical protein
LIDAVFLFAAMWLFYAVATRIFLKRNLAILCTIWLGVAALFHYGVRGNFSVYNPYDLPAFLIGIAALYICFNRPQWRWLLIPLIGIGALNRETTLFLVPLLYFCFPQNRRVMAIGLALLAWAVAYLVSRKIVAPTQPGSWMLLYEGDVLRPIATLRRLGSDMSSVITFSMFGAFSWLPLAIDMKRIRGSVFSLFWPSILLTLALYSVVANIDELRIYNEILPMIVLQGAAITFSMFGIYKIEALKPSYFVDPSPARVAYS